jgi:hypothetical protein
MLTQREANLQLKHETQLGGRILFGVIGLLAIAAFAADWTWLSGLLMVLGFAVMEPKHLA